ncbi:MAG: hypothetical protein ABSA11_03070 [Candidatus Bathyarchaeia archaeon]
MSYEIRLAASFVVADVKFTSSARDYKALPRSLHRYFEKPTQEEELAK